jgi:hypothetical protein
MRMVYLQQDGGVPTDVIKYLGELWNIGHRSTISAGERSNANGGSENKLSACRILSKLLQKREEVCWIIRRDRVTAYTLFAWIFPAKNRKEEGYFGINFLRDSNTTHSKSIPSRPYCDTRPRTALTNAVRFSADATAVEKYWDPVQPPMERMAWTSWNASQWVKKDENKEKRETPTFSFALLTKSGKTCLLTSSRAMTEVSGVVVANANVKAVYFSQERLAGGLSTPSQPGYHPVATKPVLLEFAVPLIEPPVMPVQVAAAALLVGAGRRLHVGTEKAPGRMAKALRREKAVEYMRFSRKKCVCTRCNLKESNAKPSMEFVKKGARKKQ